MRCSSHVDAKDAIGTWRSKENQTFLEFLAPGKHNAFFQTYIAQDVAAALKLRSSKRGSTFFVATTAAALGRVSSSMA